MGSIVDWNEKELVAFRQAIDARLAELSADLDRGKDGTNTVALDQQAIGRLSRQDALINQAMSQAQQSRRRAERQRLKAALLRLSEGEYGYCEDCGDALPIGRLKLDLAATRCVECASG